MKVIQVWNSMVWIPFPFKEKPSLNFLEYTTLFSPQIFALTYSLEELAIAL